MTLNASFLFAWRILWPLERSRSAARRSIIGAVFCIALSLIPLVVVLIVADGMINGITNRIIELSSYHIQVRFASPVWNIGGGESFSEFASMMTECPGVTAAYGELRGVALAAGQNGRTGASIRAVDSTKLFADESFSSLFTVEDGVLALPDVHSAVVGTRIAETLQLSVGDTIRLITMRRIGERTVPRVVSFTISGIVSCGYQELDALWIFIPLEAGFSFFSPDSCMSIIGVRTSDAFNQENLYTIKQQLQQLLPANSGVYLWNQLNVSQFENFASTKMLLLFIMFLIVLVASVNVSSALVMLVMERRREIAILKSVGASPSGILLAFLFIGFFTGFAGVLVGIPLGLVLGVNINKLISLFEQIVNTAGFFLYSISGGAASDFVPVHLLDPAYYLQQIPIVIPFEELFVIASGTLLLSVIMSVMPSIRAAREKPIATLRKV